MLAKLTDAPFDRAGWVFEVKWDGYRAIARVADGHVELASRNDKSLNDRFPQIVQALQKLKHAAVLDGEIVALDAKGRSQFQWLQNFRDDPRGEIVYCVFDLLHLDGRDLRSWPLIRRKEALRKIVARLPRVQFSSHIDEQGVAFFRAAAKQGLEGIMAKDGSSLYRDGARSSAWLKIKTRQRQEAVIGGFTEPRRSRQHLGALLLGVYDAGRLCYIGHTGGGFDDAELGAMHARLRPLIRRTSPFVPQPKPNAPVHWVAPKLVCEVEFQEWTSDGILRQPIFIALRDDKPARSVRRELVRKLR